MPRRALQTLSEPMYYVLLALTKELYGTEIMSEVKRISNGRIHIGPGTLYTMLDKFYTAGLIKRTNNGLATKSYIITDEGQKMLREEYTRLNTLISDGEKVMEVLK
ncbi:MAG: PadR family transcriptional regulator [Clostridia bacterium]|nr:PadR family transcriptional regulator [Clostridia bacterium]